MKNFLLFALAIGIGLALSTVVSGFIMKKTGAPAKA